MENKSCLGIKNSKDAILTLDQNGKILRASFPVKQVIGYSPEELVGKLFAEFLPDPNEQRKILIAIRESIAQGCMAVEEVHFRHKDSRDLFVEMILLPFPAGTECQCFLRNVTRLREADQHLEKANAMRAQFTATVSHELRTPLSVMTEVVAMLLTGEPGPLNEKQKQFLEMARTNVERLGKLINQTLDLKALEQGRTTLYIRENSIGEVFYEAANAKKPAADKKMLRIIPQADPSVPRINFDREKILECFEVLLDFAIQKSEKGDILLQARTENNLVEMSIRVPLEESPCEDLSRLFVPFEALDDEEKVKLGRTGVEFARIREIIEKHRGRIWAYFFAGKGVFFNILLPIWERRARRE